MHDIDQPVDEKEMGPATAWLAAGLLLAGLGTVLLGPILPVVAHKWQLTDQESGLLVAAKFSGAFLGGISVPRRLAAGIASGTVVAALGFAAFGAVHGPVAGCAMLFVAGFGLGQIIASTNILAGRRFASHTGSALSSLNFFFSFGAILCGLLAAAVLPRVGLLPSLLAVGGLFLVAGLGGALQRRTVRRSLPSSDSLSLSSGLFTTFAVLLFLYGGLETCLTAWLTTYALRLGGAHLLGGQTAVVLLWVALSCGRLIASVAMRWISEAAVQRTALAFTTVFAAALFFVQSAAGLSLDTLLLGLALAPFFPATFGMLMRHKPSARQAGVVLAVSGLGAAVFPWLMGVFSTRFGSLRLAMTIPLALAVALLLVSSGRPGSGDVAEG